MPRSVTGLFLSVFLTSALFLTAMPPAEAKNKVSEVKVQVNDDLVHFPDALPFIDRSYRMQVPIRFISEQLGFEVGWEMDGSKVTVTLSNEQHTVRLRTEDQAAYVNGEIIHMDSSAVFSSGRVYVPLRFVSDAFGIEVDWNQENHIAILSQDGKRYKPAWIATKAAEIGPGLPYEKVMSAKATAYSADPKENGGWGAVDYFGNPLKLGTIAVDQSIIPLGTKVYITGYNFDGLPGGGMVATATDIGGAIDGSRIDIFIPGSPAKVRKFGIQDVQVYILK